jgi:hypothetical protein
LSWDESGKEFKERDDGMEDWIEGPRRDTWEVGAIFEVSEVDDFEADSDGACKDLSEFEEMIFEQGDVMTFRGHFARRF